jgi:hypothetical protein
MTLIEEFVSDQLFYKKLIYRRIHNIILDAAPSIEMRLRFGIPFYDFLGWMCYMKSDRKGNGVYIAFIRGFELSNEQGLLEANGRTQIKSITYFDVKEIKEEPLREIIHEALLLNEEHYKSKKTKNSRKAK